MKKIKMNVLDVNESETLFLCRDTCEHYYVTDNRYNVMYRSKLKGSYDDIAVLSPNGKRAAVYNENSLCIYDFIESTIKLNLSISLFSMVFIDNDKLLIIEETGENNYLISSLDIIKMRKNEIHSMCQVSLGNFSYINNHTFIIYTDLADGQDKFLVVGISGIKLYKLNDFIKGIVISNSISFSKNSDRFICIKRKNLLGKAEVNLVDINNKSVQKLVSLRFRDINKTWLMNCLCYLTDNYFSIKLNDRIMIYSINCREPVFVYETNDYNMHPFMINGEKLLLISDHHIIEIDLTTM